MTGAAWLGHDCHTRCRRCPWLLGKGGTGKGPCVQHAPDSGGGPAVLSLLWIKEKVTFPLLTSQVEPVAEVDAGDDAHELDRLGSA